VFVLWQELSVKKVMLRAGTRDEMTDWCVLIQNTSSGIVPSGAK
jgi:hypothetical protein